MLALLRFELIYYIKNKKEAIRLYGYYLTYFLLFSFALSHTSNVSREVILALLWVGMLVGMMLTASELFERDAESGRIELYQLLPQSLEGLIFVKWLGFYALTFIPLLTLLPLAMLLLPVENMDWLKFAMGLAVGAIPLSAIACLAAGLMTGGQARGVATLSLVILPLSLPTLIAGLQYSDQPQLAHSALWFMIGLGSFLLPLLCVAVAAQFRRSN